jgi:hypothetical protein
MGRNEKSEEAVRGKGKKWLPMQLKSLDNATDLIKAVNSLPLAAIRAKAKSSRAADPFAG